MHGDSAGALAEAAARSGLCFRVELRPYAKTQLSAHKDTGAAAIAAAATPTQSGWYAVPFFHRPQSVADKLRATLRRASRMLRPSCSHLLYCSAKGLSPWAAADLAAPRIVLFKIRLTCLGTCNCSRPTPLRRRSSPMPRYFHNADLLLKRQGVSKIAYSVAPRTQPIPGNASKRTMTSSCLDNSTSRRRTRPSCSHARS